MISNVKTDLFQKLHFFPKLFCPWTHTSVKWSFVEKSINLMLKKTILISQNPKYF